MTREVTDSAGRRGPRRLRMMMLAGVAMISGVMAAATTTTAVAKDTATISVVLALSGNEWSTEILAGANAAAADLDGKVKIRVTGPPGFDPQTQAQLFLKELDVSPDALIVVNVAPPLFTQPAQEADSRGAKVVWINVPPTTDIPDAFLVSADAFDMGQRGGAVVAPAIIAAQGGKDASEITGDIAVGICEVGLAVLENRIAGEIAYLKKQFPKVNFLPKFKTNSDRSRNFQIWDEAIRKTPDALTYITPCEQGEENIPKILEDAGTSRPMVSYDTPEEVRDDIAKGTVLGAIPSNFFMQAYMAVYFAAKATLEDKPLPKGWLKVPTVLIDKSNIEAYSKAWEKPDTGLKEFYAPQIAAAKSVALDNLPEADSYNHPPQD